MNIPSELKNVSLFRDIQMDKIEKLAKNLKTKSYEKEETVLYKGDPGTDLCIVLNGSFRGVLIDEDGDEILLYRFRKYDFFGEFSLIDQKERAGNIIADEDSILLKIGREPFFRMVHEEPKLAIAMMCVLTERLRKADELIESLAFLNVKDRIMKQLYEFALDSGEKAGQYYRIRKFTHQEISSMIGASRESVTKCLKILNIEGMIKIKGDSFYVKEPCHLY
ncbi:Crp/Fnr family transcriptional regulator [Limisalsivibrio acetivorans]|uniref:Crp/Fnr family transcriptional regulator n=1 Tax=Limisalsivibrio acetivorans TaxID=1304888 RepID=UPI0003B6B9C2|nr:Crp/Fnr family transcriptional regulator [Limisalsivibrio acetivorans]